jgi:hypothetical protein
MLIARGCNAHVAYVLPVPGLDKVGIDDALVAWQRNMPVETKQLRQRGEPLPIFALF